jgi:hypothetical protein
MEIKVKTFVRPVLVLVLLGAVIVGHFVNNPLPQWLQTVFLAMTTWYFGERAYKRARENA